MFTYPMEIISFMLSELIYYNSTTTTTIRLQQFNFCGTKGCRKGSRGTKDHLLVERLVMETARHRSKNLFMAWVDYKKAYDSVHTAGY